MIFNDYIDDYVFYNHYPSIFHVGYCIYIPLTIYIPSITINHLFFYLPWFYITIYNHLYYIMFMFMTYPHDIPVSVDDSVDVCQIHPRPPQMCRSPRPRSLAASPPLGTWLRQQRKRLHRTGMFLLFVGKYMESYSNKDKYIYIYIYIIIYIYDHIDDIDDYRFNSIIWYLICYMENYGNITEWLYH